MTPLMIGYATITTAILIFSALELLSNTKNNSNIDFDHRYSSQ